MGDASKCDGYLGKSKKWRNYCSCGSRKLNSNNSCRYMKTPIQELTEIINKIIPERNLVEVWCDCGDLMNLEKQDNIWEGKIGDKYYCIGCDVTVFHKGEISIADILIALERKNPANKTNLWIETGGALKLHGDDGNWYIVADINLALPLSHPENEPAVRELIKLLK